ncbi:MAG: helix-turn-helix transcriptional regulator [Streptosporangiaceae bacterium]
MDLNYLGITPNDELVYRFFLRHPQSGLPFAVAELDMDRDAVEASVEQLVELSLLDITDGHRVIPTDPSVGIERLIEARLNLLNKQVQHILALRSSIASLQDDQRQGELSEAAVLHIERVQGVDRVRQRIDDLAFFAYQETLCLQPGGPLVEGAIEAALPLDIRSLRRGIVFRSVYQSTTLQDAKMSNYLRDIASLGADIRITDDSIDRLLIYDRSVAVVPLDPKMSARGALLVREPGLVSQMVAHFYVVWDSAKAIGEYTGVDSDVQSLSSLEREVLQALANADKDEIAARQMGVSIRTFRRYVADLMSRLGAANRFHAALLAKEKGWI